MNPSAKRYFSFITTAVLIFAASSLLGLLGGVSTGPTPYSIGLPPWLVVHCTRGAVSFEDVQFGSFGGVSFEDFRFRSFVFAVCSSILATWILLRLLRGRRKTS
jgi:hypothetical protein